MRTEIHRPYPVFERPEEYSRKRTVRAPLERVRYACERAALSRCLRATSGVRTVIDVPCGVGRLFGFWRGKGLRVVGVEISPAMAEAARRSLGGALTSGEVRVGDAFALPLAAREQADLLTCVRFLYYFDEVERARLFRGFHAATKRYLLLQFKDGDTLVQRFRAWRREKRSERRLTKAKIACTRAELARELGAAGFRVVRSARPHPLTDRAFLLAEKT